jgi:hypothetical protein
MAKKVQFGTHRRIDQPAEVRSKTRQGGKVKLVAERKASVPVRVKFVARGSEKQRMHLHGVWPTISGQRCQRRRRLTT